ncbi:MAG: hypothetical protein WCO23_00835 [bacterium]
MEGFLFSDKLYRKGEVVENIWLEPDIESVYQAMEKGGHVLSVVQTDRAYDPLVNDQISCKAGVVISSVDISNELRQFGLWCVEGAKGYSEREKKTTVAELLIRAEAKEALQIAKKFANGEVNHDQVVVLYSRLKPILEVVPMCKIAERNWWQKMWHQEYEEMSYRVYYAELAVLSLINPDHGMSAFWTLYHTCNSVGFWYFDLLSFHKKGHTEFQRMIIGVLNS